MQSKAGLWLSTRSSVLAKGRVRDADFAILGVNPLTHGGRELLAGLYGLAFPLLANTILAAAGLTLPWAVPAVAGLLAAGVFFLIPEERRDPGVRRRLHRT